MNLSSIIDYKELIKFLNLKKVIKSEETINQLRKKYKTKKNV